MQPSQYQNEPSGELPRPQEGYGQPSPEMPEAPHEQQQGAAIEQGVPSLVPPLSTDQPTQTPAQVPPPLMPPISSTTPAADPPQMAVQLPAIADDNDLIEKEWVTKAKHIVEQTKHDPYAQNQEVNKMKADYLKKRYNKDLKLSDS
jgi:hypothetical protein